MKRLVQLALKGLGLSVLVIGVVAAVVPWVQGRVTHEVEGWCLSYDRDAVTYLTENPAVNRFAPFFVVPFDIATSRVANGSVSTGWSVRYTKRHSATLKKPLIDGCEGTKLANGLVRFPPRPFGASPWPAACPRMPFDNYFVPDASDPLSTRIRINCDPVKAGVACRMTDRMPNGWQATVSLPQTHIDRWRDASRDAREYFDAYMTDCGEPE